MLQIPIDRFFGHGRGEMVQVAVLYYDKVRKCKGGIVQSSKKAAKAKIILYNFSSIKYNAEAINRDPGQ